MFIPKSNFSLKPCQLKGHLWYDAIMLNRKVLVTTFIALLLILMTLQPLWSISALREGPLWDPFSSTQLLKERNFSRELSLAEEEALKSLEIDLVTVGRGDPLYVWFGHTGLVVVDKRVNRSVMYDYGIFSFGDDFYQTFAMGRLNYQVWATSAIARYDQMVASERSVTKLKLNLDDSATIETINFLNFNVLEENNTYLYHHYRENCSTKIRDIIDKAVGGQFKAWAISIEVPYTLRQLVMLHSAPSPLIDWLLNFLQSGTIDGSITLWEAMFLPAVLERALLNFEYLNSEGESVKIATDYEVLNEEPLGVRPTTRSEWKSTSLPTFLVALAVALLLRGLLYLARRSKVAKVAWGSLTFLLYFVLGVLSLLLLFMVTISNHDVTYWNENLLFATPWLVVMAIQALIYLFSKTSSLKHFKRGNTFFVLLMVAYIIVKVAFPTLLIQQNWPAILTFLPLFVTNSLPTFKRRS